MTALEADLAELDTAIARLDASRAVLADRVTALDEAVDAAQREWTGAAASAHDAARRQLMAGIAELQTALAGLRAVAKHAHASYSEAALADTATWESPG